MPDLSPRAYDDNPNSPFYIPAAEREVREDQGASKGDAPAARKTPASDPPQVPSQRSHPQLIPTFNAQSLPKGESQRSERSERPLPQTLRCPSSSLRLCHVPHAMLACVGNACGATELAGSLGLSGSCGVRVCHIFQIEGTAWLLMLLIHLIVRMCLCCRGPRCAGPCTPTGICAGSDSLAPAAWVQLSQLGAKGCSCIPHACCTMLRAGAVVWRQRLIAEMHLATAQSGAARALHRV